MYIMLHRHALASEVMILPCLMSEYPSGLCDSRFASFFIHFIRHMYVHKQKLRLHLHPKYKNLVNIYSDVVRCHYSPQLN